MVQRPAEHHHHLTGGDPRTERVVTSLGFSPSDQYVFDTDDRKFGNDTMATIVLQPDSSVFEEINPGNTVTAQLVFDMPEGATADRIELHDSMFSGGADVALR
ncbi:DUF4352 domain-containing protein [Nocardia sp. NPDC057668]|uniref:DUF4352 domain-containing protein n=1 Tax=Nocardia sp. NPDC057668 TaxID=3346202 RepID=UPI00366F92FC